MEGKTTQRSRARRPQILTLPAHLDIAHAGELKQTLDAALAAKPPVILDATAVELVDTAGLQLLLAFRRARAADWRNPSSALCDAAALAGLSGALALDATPESRIPNTEA